VAATITHLNMFNTVAGQGKEVEDRRETGEGMAAKGFLLLAGITAAAVGCAAMAAVRLARRCRR
jgi:hypothetical protein